MTVSYEKQITATLGSIRQDVQNLKIDESKLELYKAIAQGKFTDEFDSYVGSITAQNRYDDADKFFRVMNKSPQRWRQPFTFYPTGFFNRELLFQAVSEAVRIINYQTSRFIGATRSGFPSTGNYRRSLVITKVEGETRDFLTSPDQILNEGGASIIQIYNSDEGASSIEKNAVYYAQIGGIFFFAANLLREKYPELGIRFTYYRGANIGPSHLMMVPVLTIGDQRLVRDKIRKPGRNYRRRARDIRRRRR